ncbi:TolC family protein [Sesbania bispinosa]|nr:TolC family protein [Sesbania bispinosa]
MGSDSPATSDSPTTSDSSPLHATSDSLTTSDSSPLQPLQIVLRSALRNPNHFSELGTDLVPTLPSLNVKIGCGRLESEEALLRRSGPKRFYAEGT